MQISFAGQVNDRISGLMSKLRNAALFVVPVFKAGIGNKEEREARRIFLVNIVAASAAATCLFFLVNNLLSGTAVTDKFVVQTFGFMILFGTVVAVNWKRPSIAPIYLFVLLIFLTVSLALEGGRTAGTHYFLLAVGPMMPLLLGSRRVWLVALMTALATFAFVAIEFTVPAYVLAYRDWLPQIRNPFVESLHLAFDDRVFIFSMIALESILVLATIVSMRMADNAEAALEREYARSELLLQSLLPRPIAARLKDKPDGIIADEFDLVTVLFADVVNFTPRASAKKPDAVIKFLERIFSEFDALVEKHGLEKIKTIGDSYMVAGGMPERGGDHTDAVANMALDMINVAESLTKEFGEEVAVRIGFHAGPAIAGVIGRRKPFYDVWGDTINVAARMESAGTPGRIQITPEVKDILGSRFLVELRGTIDIKGKGPMPLYYLNGRSV